MKYSAKPVLLCLILLLLFVSSCTNTSDSNRTDRGEKAIDQSNGKGSSVLIVTIDTWRWDYIGASGSGKVATPNLDRLAKEGVYIPEIETPCPLTTPAHTSLFTGLRPLKHRIFDCVHYTLDAKIPTLAEGFQEKGYTTAAFVSGETLKKRFGLDRGFSHYDDSGMGKRTINDWMSATRDGGTTTNEVLTYLSNHAGTSPFFLWVHYYDLHIPYRKRPAMAPIYPEDPYAQQTAYVDEQIGRLVEWIKSDTHHSWRILITGDHGEGLGDHGESGHGYGLHREVRTVPLIIYPKPGNELVYPQPWSLEDLEPTLRDWFNLGANPGVDGEDLFKKGSEKRYLHSMTLLPSLMFSVKPTLSVRTERYLYIQHGEEELYNLEIDPGETKNLCSVPEERAHYDELRRECQRYFPSDEIQKVIQPTLSMTSEEEKRLASLGYLSGFTPNMARLQNVDLYTLLKDFERMEGTREMCYRNGHWEEMVHAYSAFLKKYPRSGTVWKNYGKLLLRLKKYDQALPALEQAIKLNPTDDEDSCLNLGTLFLQHGKIAKAEILLKRAAQLSPDDPVVHKNLGILYAEYKHDSLKAVYHYRKYLELRPEAPERQYIDEYIKKHDEHNIP